MQVDDVDPDSVAEDDPQRRTYTFNPAAVIEQVGTLSAHSTPLLFLCFPVGCNGSELEL